MDRLLLYTAAVLSTAASVYGLQCWTCENARSEKECRRDGRAVTCSGHIMSCQTEVRHHEGWGQGTYITKRCKQTLACQNNELQNPRRAWSPSQCSPNLRNSVCRCCCKTDNCNKNNLWCIKGRGNDRCETLPKPLNGFKRCKYVTGPNRVGSVCRFRCKKGYTLRGSATSTCIPTPDRTGATYDTQPPTCVRPTGSDEAPTAAFEIEETHTPPEICDTPPPAPATGGRSCVSSKEGTVCTYFCAELENVIGPSVLTCQYRGIGHMGWDLPAPTCQPRCALFPASPMNGKIACEGEGEVHTVCEFSCDDGYDIIGERTTVCVMDRDEAVWVPDKKPSCKKISCPAVPALPFGEVTCTNGTGVGSVCTYSCTEGYGLQPVSRAAIMCTEDAVWSGKRPCCSRQCPPHAPMDVVIVLDSSSSVGHTGWKIMKDFVTDVISSFDVSRTSAHFAIFRFNGKVDTRSQILFNDFPEDKAGLLSELAAMPYDGRGTLIGQALNHTKNVMLKRGNRKDIQDMVWVMTDGVSFDDVHDISEEIRGEGAEIYAMGIARPNRRLDRGQLLSMGGDEDHVLMADGGLESLTGDLVQKVTATICQSTCE